MKRLQLAAFALLLHLAAMPAWAQRDKAPSAEEIAAAARTAELDSGAAVRLDSADAAPAKARYTPIKPPSKFDEKTLEDGVVVGELRASALSPKLNNQMTLFVCKVGKKFEAFVVRDGKLLKVVSSTSVAATKAEKAKAPVSLSLVQPSGRADSGGVTSQQERLLRIVHHIGRFRVTMTFVL